MTTFAIPPLERDMLPPAPPQPDRLPPMLFLAALFHAIVILGVSFDVGLEFSDSEATTLDVVIIASADQSIRRPDEAAYLAQASQEGDGNTSDKRTASAAPLGVPAGGPLTELLGEIPPEYEAAHRVDQAFVTTLTPNRYASHRPDEAKPEPAEADRPPASLPSGSDKALPLPAELLEEQNVYDENPRELVFSVDTQESDLAAYLAAWKAKVERIGTEYYNREKIGRNSGGNPTIKVAIDATGDLKEVVISRSSGDARLDQAALRVLRRAAPYDPIPSALRDDYDLMRFEYKFEFRRNSLIR